METDISLGLPGGELPVSEGSVGSCPVKTGDWAGGAVLLA